MYQSELSTLQDMVVCKRDAASTLKQFSVLLRQTSIKDIREPVTQVSGRCVRPALSIIVEGWANSLAVREGLTKAGDFSGALTNGYKFIKENRE